MKKPTSDRRKGQDRRHWRAFPGLPFLDSNREMVTDDRRRLPDRRLSNLSVDWDSDEAEEVDYSGSGELPRSKGS